MKVFAHTKELIHAAAAIAMICDYTAAHANVMVGSYVPADGWSVAPIEKINASSHKDMAFINLFSNFSYGWPYHLSVQADTVFNQGSVPLISWMPIDGERKSTNILGEIIDGQWDNYIEEWANGLKTWVESKEGASNAAVMLRFGHEFNGNWYSYGNDPEHFKAAWRHVHALFEQVGAAPYVQWIWCANNINVDDVNDMTQYYPGDDVVDWTSLDGYNWGSNYSFTQWKSFEQVFANGYNTLVDNYPSKPIMLAEFSSTEPLDTPDASKWQFGDDSDANEDKSVWIEEMLTILPEKFPAVRAISLFNYNKELGWALNGQTAQGVENTGLDSWNKIMASDYYQTQYFVVKERETTSLSSDRGKGKKLGKSVTTCTFLTSSSSNDDFIAYIYSDDQIALATGMKPEPYDPALEAKESAGFKGIPGRAFGKRVSTAAKAKKISVQPLNKSITKRNNTAVAATNCEAA